MSRQSPVCSYSCELMKTSTALIVTSQDESWLYVCANLQIRFHLVAAGSLYRIQGFFTGALALRSPGAGGRRRVSSPGKD